jgi:hypothetical protein
VGFNIGVQIPENGGVLPKHVGLKKEILLCILDVFMLVL